MAFFERNIGTQVAANLLCDELDILCFDEFQVTDIQDMLDMGEKLGWLQSRIRIALLNAIHTWNQAVVVHKKQVSQFLSFEVFKHCVGFPTFFLFAECRLPPPFSLYIFSMRIEIWSWGQGEGFQDCWLCGSRYLLSLQPNYVNFASSFMLHWSIILENWTSSEVLTNVYIYIIDNICYIYIYVFSPASPFNNSWRAFGSFNRMRPFCHVSLRPRFLLTLGANFMSFHLETSIGSWTLKLIEITGELPD